MAEAHECNCPSPVEVFDRVDRAIAAGGWFIITVDGLGEEPSWGYTIGLTEQFGHPELVIAGACDCCVGRILSDAAGLVASGEPPPVPSREPVLLGDGSEVHFRRVDPAHWQDGWFAVWAGYYGSKPWATPPPSAVQVVFADGNGRYPWDPGCDAHVRREQAVLLNPRRNRATHHGGSSRRRRRSRRTDRRRR